MKTTTETTENKRQKLIEEHEKSLSQKLNKFDREEAIRAAIPEHIREGCSICIHDKFASVSCWSNFRTTQKLADALEIINAMSPHIVICEHWRDGCLSTWPEEINTCAKNEKATMDGSHAVEIKVEAGRGYGPYVTIRFWVKLPDVGLVEICCPVCDLWKLVPRVQTNYDRRGNLLACRIDWPVESRCVDSFRKWWSEKPSYNGSYYLADLPNFLSWAGAIQQPKAANIN